MNGLVFHLATLMFIGLKVTNNIDWSWWQVTLPTWGLFLFQFVAAFVIFFWLAISKSRFRR